MIIVEINDPSGDKHEHHGALPINNNNNNTTITENKDNNNINNNNNNNDDLSVLGRWEAELERGEKVGTLRCNHLLIAKMLDRMHVKTTAPLHSGLYIHTYIDTYAIQYNII